MPHRAETSSECCNTFWVNSLHGQGAKTLSPQLRVEARAPDGLVEAFRRDGSGFLLGVQWHPEWRVTENPFYLGIFNAFGEACRSYALQRKDRK